MIVLTINASISMLHKGPVVRLADTQMVFHSCYETVNGFRSGPNLIAHGCYGSDRTMGHAQT